MARDDAAATTPSTPVVIPVLDNDTAQGQKRLAVLRVTQPTHGHVIINGTARPPDASVTTLLGFAAVQLSNSVVQIADTSRFPRSSIISNGLWRTRSPGDWASGFFPGCLWLLYDQLGDPSFKNWAESWTAGITSQQFNPNTDDLGFMINCSFGNGYRLTTNADFKAVLLQAARSVSNRFNSAVGAFGFPSSATNADYEVWLDSVMNMELLFHAARLSGDTNFYRMAFSHAENTMQNHIRTNGSTYHLVYYDGQNGAVKGRGTYAGYSDESTWARGHAWATYGFTMAYRETRDLRFLDAAERVAGYYLANSPPDGVPYWDYDAPDIPSTPRDSSAAAITMSALTELSQLVTNDVLAAKYWNASRNLFNSLSSTNYLAQGSISSGILLHGVGETPPLWDQEIDVSLIYADYYFIEALKRYRQLFEQRTVTYFPDSGFEGADSFAYQVCDSGGECATAVVSVSVAPRLTISFNGASTFPSLSFNGSATHSYDLECADLLGSPANWRTLASNLAGADNAITVTDTNLQARRFYRVRMR